MNYMKIEKDITKKSQERLLQFKNVISLIESEYSNTLSLDDFWQKLVASSKVLLPFFL